MSNVTERMLAWDENFLHDEWSGIEKLNWKTPYKVYYCNAKFNKPGDCSYPDLLTNSAMAKNAVGPGTNQAWVFGMIAELYNGLRKQQSEDARLAFRDGKFLSLTDAEFQAADHIYTETVERYVINAIKHIMGGAMQHEKFLLKNLGENKGNLQNVVKTITNEMHYTKREAMTIITLAIWANTNELIELASAFLKMHNKGEVDAVDLNNPETFKWFELLVEHSFFGKMIKPVFEIHKIAEGLIDINGNESDVSEIEVSDIL